MKKLYLLSLFILIGLFGMAQQSLSIPYQALVRDANGNPVTNQQISAKITLLQDSIGGTEVFSETHTTTTNAFGQMELQIGSANIAAFDTIGWSVGKMFIRLEVDLQTGEGFREIGTHQLLAVPYAKYAESGVGMTSLNDSVSYLENRHLKISQKKFLTISDQDTFQYSDMAIPNYGLGWLHDPEVPGGASCFISGWNGIKFFSHTEPAMFISKTANVGIGTTSPITPLHIDVTKILNGKDVTAILGNSSGDWTYFGGVTGGRIRGSNEGYLVLESNPDGTSDKRLYLNYQSEGHVSSVMGGGNFGIGYTTPAFKLHVNGEIKASNVKIDKQDFKSALGNDYLMEINEIEEYIKKEKQLPGAKQLIDNDTTIDLAKMNSFLLNKIEELTLYTIQQQKLIDIQNQRFENLEAEFENLKNK